MGCPFKNLLQLVERHDGLGDRAADGGAAWTQSFVARSSSLSSLTAALMSSSSVTIMAVTSPAS